MGKKSRSKRNKQRSSESLQTGTSASVSSSDAVLESGAQSHQSESTDAAQASSLAETSGSETAVRVQDVSAAPESAQGGEAEKQSPPKRKRKKSSTSLKAQAAAAAALDSAVASTAESPSTSVPEKLDDPVALVGDSIPEPVAAAPLLESLEVVKPAPAVSEPEIDVAPLAETAPAGAEFILVPPQPSAAPEPAPIASIQSSNPQSQLASPLLRMCAFAYDILFLVIINLIIFAFAGFRFLHRLMGPVQDEINAFHPAEAKGYFALAVAASVILSWLYFSLVESLPVQGTLGKRIFYLRTTDPKGAKISFLRSNLRLLGKVVSCATLGIGFAISLFRADRRTLHDIIADTQVLKDRRQ